MRCKNTNVSPGLFWSVSKSNYCGGSSTPSKALGDVPIWHRFTTEDDTRSGHGGPDQVLTTVVFVGSSDHFTGAPIID